MFLWRSLTPAAIASAAAALSRPKPAATAKGKPSSSTKGIAKS